MRFLIRWAFRLFIVLVVLAVALVLLKDTLLKSFAEYQIRAQTGMDPRIGRLNLALFSPTVALEDFKLYNPAVFGGSPFLDMPDLHIEYSPGSLLRGRVRFPLVRVSLTEVNIVESQDGRTNLVYTLDKLKSATAPVSPWNRWMGVSFGGIDVLNLTLGKVRHTSLKRPEKVTEVKLALKNEILTNLRTMADLTNQVMRTMFRNGITIVTESPAERRNLASPSGR